MAPHTLPRAAAGATSAMAEGEGRCVAKLSLAAVEEYIQSTHVKYISWHCTLNNHASQRPQEFGGPLVPALSACKSYEEVAAAGATVWRCSLTLPNSFAPNDGLRLYAEGVAHKQAEADERACRHASALLLSMNPVQVVLRPKHWNVQPEELLAHIRAAVGASASACTRGNQKMMERRLQR